MDENKEWRPVVGFEEYFMVSDHGDIFSNRTNKILKSYISKAGYNVFVTRFNGRNTKSKLFRVHRLVAEAFIDNCLNKPYVNHIDADKTNNHVSNLEWVTPKENAQHAKHMGLMEMPKNHHNKKSKFNKYEGCKIILEYFRTGVSARSLGRKYDTSHYVIMRLLNNKHYYLF